MNDTHKSSSGFWFGMIMGAALGASSLFFLGTKKGRKYAKKVIDSTEDWEMVLEDIVSQIDMKTEGPRHEFSERMKEYAELAKDDIGTVMDKISQVAEKETKVVKKYFSKDGKILK